MYIYIDIYTVFKLKHIWLIYANNYKYISHLYRYHTCRQSS